MGSIILPELQSQASKLIIEFKAPGSAEFVLSIEGTITPAQKFVAAGWLASDDCADLIAVMSEPDSDGIIAASGLTLDFGAPGSAELTPSLAGRITRNQLYAAAKWFEWAGQLDFTSDAQRRAYVQMQEQQRNQAVLAQLGGGRR